MNDEKELHFGNFFAIQNATLNLSVMDSAYENIIILKYQKLS